MNEIPFNSGEFAKFGVRLNDYFGVWSVEPTRFSQLWGMVQKMDLNGHVRQNVQANHKTVDVFAKGDNVPTEGGSIAVISVNGALTKAGCSFDDSASLVALKKQVRAAVADDGVKGILLIVDSPGGTVAGTEDLAEEVFKARQKKPIYGVVEDLGASAAYWVVSQCDKVFAANKTTLTGSIGTFMVLYDQSQQFEREGCRAVLIKAGEFKGSGTPGTEITDSHVAEHQKIVDQLQAQFTAAVQRGRDLTPEQAKSLVTGLVYSTDDALRLRLIDGVQSVDETLQQLQQASRKATNTEEAEMTISDKGSAASFNELIAACHGISKSKKDDALFLADAQGRSLTAAEANKQWCLTLIEQRDAARAETEEAEEELDKEKSRKSKKSRAEDDSTDDKDKEQSRKSRRSRAEDDRDEERKDDEDDSTAEDDDEDFDSEDDEDDKPASRHRNRSRGVRTIGTRRSKSNHRGSDAKSTWETAVSKMTATGISRAEAAKRVNARNPELRQAMLDEANAKRSR